MSLQTLVFNTTTKIVTVWDSHPDTGSLIHSYENITTVKPKEEGFYELIQKGYDDTTYPVARFPTSATNMLIQK